MTVAPASITILGGGTAGWMAACLLQQAWGERTTVRLIESSQIGIVGVGEGSTPQMKAFFDRLGVSEAEWMPRCNATYKVGIEFEGWSSRPGHERYFHPFPTALDGHSAPQFFRAARQKRHGVDVEAHPDAFLLPGLMARRKLAPISPEHFPFEVSYGYHFDAHLVGQYLKELATGWGVEWLDTKVASVEIEAGRVAALVGEDGARHAADFFIDASGFRAMIIEQALGGEHLSFADNLWADSAVVLPSGVADGGPECATRAIAMSAGWRWSIPLTNRTGNGYVYASSYLGAEEAEAELRAALGLGDEVEARHLKMRCGRMTDSWASNCLAIGLAQGFLEPLEATALHIVLATVEGFIATVDREGISDDARSGFNQDIGARYEGIRDYIVAHYRCQLRRDTQYWRDCAQNDALSPSLKGVITSWFTKQDLQAEIQNQQIARYYNAVSWHCLLAGYGNFPPEAQLSAPGEEMGVADMARIHAFLEGCAMNFPSHSDALALLKDG
ncbi:tryptophan halogenase family protein [Sphingomicrobium flavum]|uniref:tryptophan halogenase family protein n=1 Tax=Sphingomicrobium flavum TaxID=1229164 RepID=UPI0021AE0AB3|nr:tryptophan halogenase family protein [Sphingomicrobium flavum]